MPFHGLGDHLLNPLLPLAPKCGRKHLVMIAQLIARRVLPDVVSDLKARDIDLVIQPAPMLLLLGTHLHQLVSALLGHEYDLRIWLPFSKDVPISAWRSFEDHK